MTPTRVALAVLALAAGQALAQDSKTDNPLAGPPVKQARPPMFEEGMGAKEGKDRMGQQGIPAREFARIIDTLRGDQVAPSLRLSAEQSDSIRQIESDFRRQVREFEQKARAQEQKQRSASGPADGKDGGAPAAPNAAKRRANAARLEEFRRSGPKPAEAQARIWAVLTEPQQRFVQGEVDKVQKEIDDRRSDAYMQRELQKRKAKDAAPAGPAARPARPGAPGERSAADAPQRERFRRIIEKLQRLSPQEREEVLRKLEADLERLAPGDAPAPLNRPGRAGQRGRGADRGAEDKPAPHIDDVTVPSPKGGGRE
jgi:hypothetical protein